jgi:hypothetical protein
MERGLLEEQKSDREGSGADSLSRRIGRLGSWFRGSGQGGSGGIGSSHASREQYSSFVTSRYTAQPTGPFQGLDPSRRSMGSEGYVRLPDETGKQ